MPRKFLFLIKCFVSCFLVIFFEFFRGTNSMDTTKIDSDLVSKIIELSQDDAITSRPEGVEELYKKFLSK